MNSGKIRPQPLVIRANAGDCIEIRMTNFLPYYIEESPFQLRTLTDIAGFHIHLVKFDTIVSDGAANGWNNISGARKYETLIERFNANEELNTVFFHDHLFANMHQQHGLFGALIVEPAGSVFLNPKNGRPLKSGTNAVIKRADGSSFREFAMFVHDFALLFDKDNRPLNPPEHPGSDDDPGVMGISYRCEPMRERLKKKNDSSHIFSSRKYGDPATPVLEIYPGDPMVIRLLDGAHEEQHVFNRLKRNPIISKMFSSHAHGDPSTPILKAYAKERVIIRPLMPSDKPRNISFVLHGHNWRAQPDDPFSTVIPAQGAISVGGVYNIELINGASDVPGDYLYRSGSLRWDVESGMWGIFRVMSRNLRYRCRCICRNIGNWWEEQWYDKYM